ncbi:MAG TPA: amidohydrolase family protein [bacterium]|nr:amidohydrolase family protein [bacterium]HOL35263.1 amidohydrolase family protein [bacterium]HPP08722.1 amidohydrolase family protein [bacterium]
MDAFEKLYSYICSLEIIDTHEHLPPFEQKQQNLDILKTYLTHYFVRDLISAGLKKQHLEKVIDADIDIRQRWTIVEPYWNAARHTGYGRVLDICCKDLYNLPEISRSTIQELNEKFIQFHSSGNTYQKILKERSKIAFSIMPCNDDFDKKFFKTVGWLDYFIFPLNYNDVRYIEKTTGTKITCFDDWLEACETSFQKMLNSGRIGLKTSLAYKRSLYFPRVTRNEAEQDFNRIFFAKKHLVERVDVNAGLQSSEKFQNYMFHFIMQKANKNHLTVQVHTGLLEGSGNILSNSDPSLLTNLFIEYPDVCFDIFHIGYPYQNIVGALAKMFPNVWIDMCWTHAISPEASIRALVQWIDEVPLNKISGFGGDYAFVDGVYGHQKLARINIAKALCKKVKQNVFGVDRACEIAKMLLVENPGKLFNLEQKGEK